MPNNTTYCLSSELDLFQGPCKQVSQEKSVYVAHHPITSLTDNGPLEFNICGSPMYTDLSETRLYLKCRLVDLQGHQIPIGHDAGPVNMLFHALFRKVDVHLNGRLITHSNDLYPFKAGYETLLNFGKNAKETQLASAIMYHKDRALDVEVGNLGLIERKKKTENSQAFEMCGPLHVDLFFQPKYLLDNVPMRIVLSRSLPNFYLQAFEGDPECKIRIEQAILYVRRVQVSPAVQSAHAKALQHSNALYPLHRTEMEFLPISTGQRVIIKEGLFAQKVPKKSIFAILTGEAINGGYGDSCYRFVNNVVTRIDLTLDGEPIANTPISCDFTDKLCTRAYQNLFAAVNKSYTDSDIDISYEDFVGFYSLFCFDLTSDSCGNSPDHLEFDRHGNLRLVIGLTNVQVPLYVVCYGEFEGTLEITEMREVILP